MKKVVRQIGIRSARYSNPMTCYMSAGFASDFDYLYRELKEDKVIFWFSEHKNAKKMTVKKSCGNVMLNLKNTCLEGELIFVTERKGCFELCKASSPQVTTYQRRRAKGNVGYSRSFLFTKEQRALLDYKESFKKVTFVQSEGGGSYAIIEKCDPVPLDACGLRHCKKEVEMYGYSTAHLAPGKTFALPLFFREKTNIQPNDTLETEVKDMKLYIYGNPGVCAVCGRKLHRSKGSKLVRTCSCCESKFEELRQLAKNFDFDNISELVSIIDEELTELEKTV